MSTSSDDQRKHLLVHHFGEHVANDAALLAESTSLCTRYSLTPEALFYKWSAYAFNNHLPSDQPFSLHHARLLRTAIAAEHNTASTNNILNPNPSTTTALHHTPLKPSAHANLHLPNANRHNTALNHILGINAKPSPNVNAAASPFNTPARPTYANPAASTAASASAYRHPRTDADANLTLAASDLDSPLASTSRRRRLPLDAAGARSCRILESVNPEHPLDGAGCQLAAARSAVSGSKRALARVTIAVATDPRAWNYRYMFEKKGERAQVLDDRIDQFAAVMRDAYQLDAETELGDPSMPSQEPIYVVGRICPALPAPGSAVAKRRSARPTATTATIGDEEQAGLDDAMGLPKMAETGIVLEASRMMGSGNRVPLFLQKGCRVRYGSNDGGSGGGAATTVGLFPGQIVMLKGLNGGGQRFGVQEILMPPALPPAGSPADELENHQFSPAKLDGKALNVVTASGPFTDDADLEFAPWHRLLDHLDAGGLPIDGDGDEGEGGDWGEIRRRGVPDVLVLLGPFLSSAHRELPFSSEMPDVIFRRHIVTRLEALIRRYPSLVVVMLPSTLDILNSHAAYPQPGFSSAVELGFDVTLKKNIKLLPNPSVFYINELVFAATTADVLRDLKSEELVCRIEPGPSPKPGFAGSSSSGAGGEAGQRVGKDAMSRLTRHVLMQRSFYPLFPAATSSAVSLDVSHSNLLDFPAATPDVLLVPSSLQPFVRVVESTVVVNPGRMASSSPTTAAAVAAAPAPVAKTVVACASLHVVPMERKKLQREEDTVLHEAYDRVRCDVVAL
ncbi:DNA-directed DNA polymerase alpha subunit pol12 [Thecaphora frezii]